MKPKYLFITLLIVLLSLLPSRVIAVEDPLATVNNKLGVHILDPSEIEQAARLVNNEGQGEWGYVTVPIQAADRDRPKWQRFFKTAAEKKVIPIIRVATIPRGAHWDEPDNYDLVDFANFLNDLPWPTKNRYVIIFNEVNRAGEWGGVVEPERYADILSNAITIFKQRSEDFFILPAGLDNAAPTTNEFLNWKTYLGRMSAARPDLFGRLDGWTSHAYPNPGFAGKPTDLGERSVNSFKSDLAYLGQFTRNKLPVFITETGWDQSKIGEGKTAAYFATAFGGAWSDPRVVTVTPFLLTAGDGPFTIFSLTKNGSPTQVYKILQGLATVGRPVLATPPVAPEPPQISLDVPGSFWDRYQNLFEPIRRSFEVLKNILVSSFFGPVETNEVRVGENNFVVEVADSPLLRQRGLSGRSILPSGHGMLFIFDNPGYHVFWMKEMKFNLDLVWIEGGKVVGVSQAFASSPNALYTPPQPARYVLEVNANSGIKTGEEVKFNLD